MSRLFYGDHFSFMSILYESLIKVKLKLRFFIDWTFEGLRLSEHVNYIFVQDPQTKAELQMHAAIIGSLSSCHQALFLPCSRCLRKNVKAVTCKQRPSPHSLQGSRGQSSRGKPKGGELTGGIARAPLPRCPWAPGVCKAPGALAQPQIDVGARGGT